MSPGSFIVFLAHAFVPIINCSFEHHKFRSDLEQVAALLRTPGVTVDSVVRLLGDIGDVSDFGVLRLVDDPDIAEAILSRGDYRSPCSRMASLNLALRVLSRKVSTMSIAGFTAQTPEYELAQLYISEIRSAATSHRCWPTTHMSSMYELIRNGHTNIIQIFVDAGFPVERLDHCEQLIKANEDTLRILQSHRLSMSICGDRVIDMFQSPSLTANKLQIFFDAGLPKDYEYLTYNWLEQSLYIGRYDLAVCAYKNNIQLAMYRFRYNHYSGLQISVGKFIDYLVRPKVAGALQTLLQQEKGALAKLTEQASNGFIARINQAEVDSTTKKLFKECQAIDA